jgi:hypothetical protein
MKQWTALLLFSMVALLACGGPDSTARNSSLASGRQAVSGTGVVPEPCGAHQWHGTAIDLMVADALTACSGDDKGTSGDDDDGFFPNGGGPMRDGYLTYVRGRMMETLGLLDDTFPSLIESWAKFRAKSVEGTGPNAEEYNCDPITGTPKAAPITPRFIQERLPEPPPQTPLNARRRKALAELQLRSPAFHLCIAQTLRTMVPGALGGEALLLSEHDQRSLLETIRENAQIAMIDYAQLGVLFSTYYRYPNTAPPASLAYKRYLSEIQWWALTNASNPKAPLEQMGRDFAAAVQLHSVVSEELAGLLVRSRSARTPRGGDPKNRADEVWGAGSWHQRLLASMLGGDPLANPADNPWPRPDEDLLTPNSGESGLVFDIPGPAPASGHADGWDWPDTNRAPFVSTALREPQVLELFRLAKRFERVQLALKRKYQVLGGGYVCDGFDLPVSGQNLYEWVEGELRRETCYDQDGDPSTPTCCETNNCGPATKPAQHFPGEKYLLWERYRIRPEHADTLVKYLADNIDYEKLGVTPGTSGSGPQFIWCHPRHQLADPDYRAGAQLISGLMWFSGESGNSIYSMRLTSKHPGIDSTAPGLDVAFLDRPLRDVAPIYTRNAVLRFHGPWELATIGIANEQGYIGSCLPLPTDPGCLESSQDAKRLMGATSALAATRFMLMASLGSLKSGALPNEQLRLNDYFANAEDILRIVDGGVGAESVGLRPVAVLAGFTVVNAYEGGEPLWEVDVTFGTQDAFWQEEAEGYQVCAIAHPAAANLALNPGSQFGGTTVESLVADAEDANRCTSGTFWSQSTDLAAMLDTYDGAPRGWSTQTLRLPAGQDEAFTLVAFRDVEVDDAIARRYEVLGSGFSVNDTKKLSQGHYVATSGTLGNLVSRAIQGRPDNPTEPKYDGFGLRTDWVPPFTAELIGGTSEEASAARYLTLAKSAADEATAAVNDAMDSLIQEQKDDATMSAAAQRWQQGMKEEQEKLCGPDSDCDVEQPAIRQLEPDWFPNLPPGELCTTGTSPEECVETQADCRSACGTGCNGNPCDLGQINSCTGDCLIECVHVQGNPEHYCQNYCDDLCNSYCATTFCYDCFNQCDTAAVQCRTDSVIGDLGCHVVRVAFVALSTKAPLADKVVATMNEPTPPAFEEFAGGSLQGAFIAQSRALRALDDRFLVLTSTYEAARDRVLAAFAALSAADELARNQCDAQRFGRTLYSGLSVGCSGDVSSWFGSDGKYHVKGKQCSQSFSWGPLNAQLNACQDATAVIPQADAAAVASFSDGIASLAAATAATVDAQGAIVASGAEIAQLLNQARLAKSRYDLEKKLTAEGSLATSFGLYRRYRSYDVWRAKALVENARRYALAARRSVEARYVVDLSSIAQPEAFVQSPSTWADEVYGYDLSLPAAVGLTVGAEQQGGIYPNKVGDYVSNLNSFVMGYAVTRPSAVARQEVEVVNLAGLKHGEGAQLGPLEGTFHPEVGSWVLRCPTVQGSYEWRPVSSESPASQTCIEDGTSPDRARLSFDLDPWGRRNGAIANEPYARRFNGRWGLMAVNFVGTGVKDCDNASDPYACYSEGFIRYDLSHVGPAWVTDYDGIWRTLGVPIGRIEGAKALATELWLDPLKDGWNTSYISAVSRTELQLRPLGGAYELEFVITPEIDIDRIERVQLLIGSSYWVKQD